MKKQIFISSTYIDLIPYRKSIWELLQSFNVIISGMEKFGARTEKPLETCLKEVKESDFYIGIIGMRYGSIEVNTKKSFSQLEYEKAKELGKEIFIYIIDEENAKINANHIDFENYIKLREFKSLLKTNHTIDIFKNENDLILKLNDNLKKTLNSDSIKRYYRPKKIEGTIEQFKIGSENWMVILGEKYGNPFEIYIGKIDDFIRLPRWLKNGWIIKSTNHKGDFDFQFFDQEGYKVTLEGLSRLQSNILPILISKLLEKEISIDKTLEIIDEIKFDEGETEIAVKKAIRNTLLKKRNKPEI
ncbi:DUF4062 domain-containing protein [uncultured Lutibacter sp.]|uniref:DUF4062 domain-containing protein n=1 Tax=uncultured Lutibacter sp. TaxID=437739 RepID=UPI00262FD496|nr:DUF4062 domain-containing protein [uncultured Lutibacter sp.]